MHGIGFSRGCGGGDMHFSTQFLCPTPPFQIQTGCIIWKWCPSLLKRSEGILLWLSWREKWLRWQMRLTFKTTAFSNDCTVWPFPWMNFWYSAVWRGKYKFSLAMVLLKNYCCCMFLTYCLCFYIHKSLKWCSMIVYFYESCSILVSPQGKPKYSTKDK